MKDRKKNQQDFVQLLIFSLILFGIFLSSFYNYLLFHTFSEIFSIIIAAGIFLIVWNLRKNIDNSFFLIIGIGFLFIGFLDLIHTLSYSGMQIFVNYDANLPTQLWIAARYLQAFTFIFATLIVNKKVNIKYLFSGYSIITSLIIISIFCRFFPDCYIEGVGLTSFKIVSEYIIDSILFVSILLIFRSRKNYDRTLYIIIICSITTTMISELVFTFYVSVFGLSNLVGHLFKIIAFFLLYKPLIQIGLKNPLNILFHKVKESEYKLKERVKELKCLYGISKLVENPNKTFSEIIEGTLGLIPPAWQFPEITCARIIYNNKEYTALNFKETKWKLTSHLEINEKPMDIKVHYFEDKPFLKEEVNLINDIGKRLKVIIERMAAEYALKELITKISHELRTPLTVVNMSLDYLNKSKAKISQDLKDKLMSGISRNINMLIELAEDILIILKIDENKLTINPTKFYPINLFNDILTLMGPIGEEQGISFNLKIDANLFIEGDSKRIDHVFRNLIDNAIKYSKGKSEIKISSIDNYKGKYNPREIEGVLFQFQDNGIGISKEDLPNTFDRFFRSSEVSKIPGTGLGLSIARDITHLHSGEIYVVSEYGKGATFFVFLPKFQNSRYIDNDTKLSINIGRGLN